MPNFTKKAIVDTFVKLLNEQSFDKITVTDIVNECGINRNTFYYYYQDMYALVDELFRYETQRMIDEHREYATWVEGFLEATSFMRENKTAIYHLYASINRDRLEEYIFGIARTTVTDFIKAQAKGLDVADQDIEDLSTLYTVSLEGMAIEWLHTGMQRDPETYINNIARLLDGSTRELLVKAASLNIHTK